MIKQFMWLLNLSISASCPVFRMYESKEYPSSRRPVVEKFGNFCPTSPLIDSKRIEEILALAS